MYSIDLRPQRIDDMCGSSAIKKYYKNAFKDKDKLTFPQVSMFLSNIPGVGKTTSAKIIAKTLNCKSVVYNKGGYYEPCNECESCKDIISEKYNRDVHRYSGATDRTEDLLKIGDILDYSASFEKNTIILIEEFQALHSAALSSLLLLTEAPKSNIYFIFCSMSADKVSKEIAALKSRSQKFMVNLPETNEVVEYLINLLEKENKLESLPEVFFTEGLPTIASYAVDGLRVIVQNLERCLLSEIYDESTITKELGIINENSAFLLMDRLINKDKSVINDITSTDIPAFYNLSKLLYLKAMTYKVYNPDNDSAGYKKYSKNENLESLIDCYVKTEELSYFQPNVFLYNVCKFLLTSKQPLQRLVETKEQKPLQRIPVQK
jgi:DNA polymerase-3 subunit gamma/tau